MTVVIAREKANGAYYTPEPVVRSLVQWVVRQPTDRLLDPSCGDGRFLDLHPHSVGVEFDSTAAVAAVRDGRPRTVYVEDFFAWAERTRARFECAAGNPPFIRYQRFAGELRQLARTLCRREGIELSGLASSWLPFLVVTTNLLKPGGRMAFVVPAEIGHAAYAASFLGFLARRFGDVRVIAVQESVFPDLSQDAWLLYAADKGSSTAAISFAAVDRFSAARRPPRGVMVELTELSAWRSRLRPFLLSEDQRALYQRLSLPEHSTALGKLARVGIGYVSGGNEFFHLRPSQASRLGIPQDILVPSVRNGRRLTGTAVTSATVAQWIERDESCLFLALSKDQQLPPSVERYLNSAEGRLVRSGYKCRNRKPWYVVPDVQVPDAFLSYMSGVGPSLVANNARCTCTNSVHAVRFRQKASARELARRWDDPLIRLSCELEGHPLGGGMLKLEPREAARIRIPHEAVRLTRTERDALDDAVCTLRRWRHYG